MIVPCDCISRGTEAIVPVERAVRTINSGIIVADAAPLRRWLDALRSDNAQGEFYLTDVFLHLKPVTVVKLDDPISEALPVLCGAR